MNAYPRVSIVIPNYNTAFYIAQTLDSVFTQTFRDYEVIVINDGSPDTADFLKAVRPYRESIVLIDKNINEGTSVTRNQAAGIARGDYLAFLDADDIWFPRTLSRLYDYAVDTGLDAVYSDCETFTSGSDKLKDLSHLNAGIGEITRDTLIDGRGHILPSGALIRRSSFEHTGGFSPEITRTEDFDLWMRMLFAGFRIGHLDEVLFRFRISPTSGSGDAVVRIERCGTAWRMLQSKLDFTEDEKLKIERHIAENDAAVLCARGRDALFRRSWHEAIGFFQDARRRAENLGLPHAHRIKLSAVVMVLKVAPPLARKLYTAVRSEELDYLPSNMRDS